MFRKFLTQDAFTLPPPNEEVIKDYQLLYPDDMCPSTYPVAGRSLESPEQIHIQQRIFQEQFGKLLDALKAWGVTNHCINDVTINQINDKKTGVFSAEYSGTQPSAYFENIKNNLENIWFLLTYSKSIEQTKKIRVFKNLCEGFFACAPGFYTHIEDAYNMLTTNTSLEGWLTEFRTNIIREYAEVYINHYKIPENNSLHVHNALLTYAINDGLAPASKVNQILDHFIIATTGINENTLISFTIYFFNAYTPKTIIDCITTNFFFELTQRRKALSIPENNGFIPAVPDFLKIVGELCKLININNINFFDLNKKQDEMRFNSDLFRLTLLKYFFDQAKYFQPQFWQAFNFKNKYSFFYHTEFKSLCWFQNPHGELLNWKKFTEIPNYRTLIGTFLALLDQSNWPVLIRRTCISLTNIISNYKDLAEILAPMIQKGDVDKLLQLLGDELNRCFSFPLDFIELRFSFPAEELWKIAPLKNSCQEKFGFDLTQASSSLLKELQKVTNKTALELAFNAAQIGRPNTLRFLLEEGALNVDATYQTGHSLAHEAAKEDQPEIIEVLAAHKANLNAQISYGKTPLHIAAMQGNINVIHALAKHGADLNQRNTCGTAAIHIAASDQNLRLMKALIKHKVNVNLGTKSGLTAAHKAVSKNAIDIVKLLAKHHANFEQPNKLGKTALDLAVKEKRWRLVAVMLGLPDMGPQDSIVCLAAKEGNVNALRKLMKYHVNLNQPTATGATPAYLAAQYNKLDVIKFLAENNIDFFSTYNWQGKTVFDVAIESKSWDVVAFLCIHYSNILINLEKPLQIAVRLADEGFIDKLAEMGFDLNALDENNQRLIEYVISCKRHDLISALAKNHANLNLINKYGNRPIHSAVQSDNENMVIALAQNGADLNALTAFGNAPIHIAARLSFFSILKFLVDNPKVEVNKLTAMGHNIAQLTLNSNHNSICAQLLTHALNTVNIPVLKTFLDARIKIKLALTKDENLAHFAAQKGRTDLLLLAAESQIDLNERNLLGETPAHFAVLNGDVEMVKLLGELGVSFNLPNTHNVTPIKIAIDQKRWDLLVIMLSFHSLIDELDDSVRKKLSYWNNELADAFITHNKNLSKEERDKNLDQVINRKNELGIILHKIPNTLQFFTQKVLHLGSPIDKIKTAFNYDAEKIVPSWQAQLH